MQYEEVEAIECLACGAEWDSDFNPKPVVWLADLDNTEQ